MNSDNKLLSPKQRKGFGYLLLVLGSAYLLYFIASTWRREGETALTIIPGMALLIIGSILLNRKKEY